MLSAVSSRYARALVDVVVAAGGAQDTAPDQVAAQLRAMEQLLAESPELVGALLTPAVPTSRKRLVIGKFAAELHFSGLVRNFLFVLLDHKRMPLLSEIRESFEFLMDEKLGFVRAELSSAQPLDDEQVNQLQAELSRVSGRQVIMRTSIDPTLLGGVLARVGSTVYDGSIRGQIEQMRRQFVKEAAEFKMGI